MRRAVVVVLIAGGLVAGCGRRGDDGRGRCLAARDTGEWKTSVEVCRGQQRDFATLGLAWLIMKAGDDAGALTMLPPLYDGPAGPDAKYLAGYLIGKGEDGDHERARPLLQQALVAFQAAGRHDAATRAADYLSRVPRKEALFDDALAMARLAVEEAYLSQRDDIIGRAETALAEVYDDIGMADEARDAFLRAEARLTAWPAYLAYTYLKHANYLRDIGGDDSLRAAIGYLDASELESTRATEQGRQIKTVVDGVYFDRVLIHAHLGEMPAALSALDHVLQHDKDVRSKELLQAYVAARAGDVEAAKAYLQGRVLAVRPDAQIRPMLELARTYERLGRFEEAEHGYLASISRVEDMRKMAGRVELKPWVLSRRTDPYMRLIGLYARQNRGREALVVAEALHARTWLDATIGQVQGDVDTLRRARLHQRLAAESRLDDKGVLEPIRDREVLVYAVDGDGAWRFYARNGEVSVERLTPTQLATVAQFAANVDDPAASEAAARVLIPEGVATRREPLYVVAEGALASVPFAALRVDGRYLVETRPVARVPGLAVLGCRPRVWTGARVFVGDATGDLPRAAEEVRRLGGSAALVGPAATRAAVAASRDAALLHVAVHGGVTAAGGALELADGAVTAADILEQQIAPREVVLTGCATAAARDAESWGGFPSAFLAAGSQHVVATLRSVTDHDAATMSAAYYAAAPALGPVARLTAAQRQLATAHPASTWAYFAVWGDADCAAGQ